MMVRWDVCLVKIYTAFVAAIFLTASDAAAQSPLVRCPLSSSVSTVLAKLDLDVALGHARLREDLRRELREADYADVSGCLAVEKAMYT
jgi:hypothetical protein